MYMHMCIIPLQSIKFPEQFQRKGTEFISQSPTKPQCVMNHCQSTCHTPILFTHYTPVLQTCWHKLLCSFLSLHLSLVPASLPLSHTRLSNQPWSFCCALYTPGSSTPSELQGKEIDKNKLNTNECHSISKIVM